MKVFLEENSIFWLNLGSIQQLTTVLTGFYTNMEKLASAINAFIQILKSKGACPATPSQGGFQAMANILVNFENAVQKSADDLDAAMDSDGNLTGDVTLVKDDIQAVSGYTYDLSQSFITITTNLDYTSGNFAAMKIASTDAGTALTNFANTALKLSDTYRIAIALVFTSTKVVQGIKDVHTAIAALIQNWNAALGTCGLTDANIGYMLQGFTATNVGCQNLYNAMKLF